MNSMRRNPGPRRRHGFIVRGTISVFQVQKPWVYLRVPRAHTERTRRKADRGLVAIEAAPGTSRWKTSLMPMGDGTQFIPLPANVRRREGVGVGDRITLFYSLRRR